MHMVMMLISPTPVRKMVIFLARRARPCIRARAMAGRMATVAESW